MHVPEDEAETWGAELQEVRPDAFVRAILASLAWRLPHGLDRYEHDALIIVAERDYSFVRSSGRILQATLPAARVVLARGQPHTWHMLHPRLLAATIRAFLDRQPLPPGLDPLSA